MDSKFSGMLSEDRSAPANLPQGVVHKYYPKPKYMSGDLDDSMKVIDKARDYDLKKMSSQMSKEGKW